MLFNSLTFLIGFAPIVLLIYFRLGARGSPLATIWLGLASLVFYAWWAPLQTIVLLVSICFNYLLGQALCRFDPTRNRLRKGLLIVAITADLLALSYYKYANFLAHEFAAAFDLHWTIAPITLPLGISFFTFTQIAYLVDTYQNKVRESGFAHYFLFVTYFPHLIAGPVIHHGDVMPQFARPDAARFNPTNFTIGVTLFAIGLFKKVVIADNIVAYVTPVFAAAEQGTMPGMIGAWAGALAYTLQLYFDFSGYSDMAIGLSMMLNVRLPFNFNSPYRAKNIIDFWTRWHISLSIFLRDYLYIPLGGNRCGTPRRYLNLFMTMLIGGIWHGAGWTFIAWGALHGAYIMANHGWRHFRQRFALPSIAGAGIAARMLTLLAVVAGWVFFRAQSIDGAFRMIASMTGAHGMGDWEMSDAASNLISFSTAYNWIIPLSIIVLFAPNSQQIATRVFVQDGYLETSYRTMSDGGWRRPHLAWAILLGMVTAIALVYISQPSQFLYFNF